MRTLFRTLSLALVALPSVAYAQNTWTAVQGGPYIAYCGGLWTPSKDVVFVVGEIDGADGVYRSEDGGKHFAALSVPGWLRTIFPLDDQRLYALSMEEHDPFIPFVSYSEDGGRTWERRSNVINESSPAPGGAFFADDDRILVALRPQGVFESTDGGDSFHLLRAGIEGSSFGDGSLLLITDSTNFDLLRSDDGGKSFEASLDSGDSSDTWPPTLGSLMVVSSQVAFVASRQENSLLRTVDGALSWQPFALPPILGKYPQVHDMRFAPDGMHGIASVEDGAQKDIRIISTSNGGKSWVDDQLPAGMLDNMALRVPGCFSYRPDGSVMAASITAFGYPLFYLGGDGKGATPAGADAGVAGSDAGPDKVDQVDASSEPREDAGVSAEGTPKKSDGGCSLNNARPNTSWSGLLAMGLAWVWVLRRRWAQRPHARRDA
jgi:photosystem II stability/assembly factor-like uncharacterized protein